MSVCLPRAVLTISIDLDADATRLGMADQRVLDDVTGVLLDLADRYGSCRPLGPVIDPAVSAATAADSSRRAGPRDRRPRRLDVGRMRGPAQPLRPRAGRRVDRARRRRPASDRRWLSARPSWKSIATWRSSTASRPFATGSGRRRQIAPSPCSRRRCSLACGVFPSRSCLPGDSRWLPRWRRQQGGPSDHRPGDHRRPGLVQLVIDAPRLAARRFARCARAGSRAATCRPSPAARACSTSRPSAWRRRLAERNTRASRRDRFCIAGRMSSVATLQTCSRYVLQLM